MSAPIPSGERDDNALRRALYTMRRGLWPLQRKRVRACGFARAAQNVSMVVDQHGQGQFRGLQHCSCAWECPVCQMLVKSRRREEVTEAVTAWGGERCLLFTLTLRHGAGDDLRDLRQNLARAYSAFVRGRPWQRFTERAGIFGSIRAMELTHSARNGWHPHLHVVWFLREPLDVGKVLKTGDGVRYLHDELAWLQTRWRTMVKRFVGDAHAPDDVHGVTLSPIAWIDPQTGEAQNGAGYIAKLGLELANPGNKKGRKRGSRTPLQIAFDFVEHGRRRDAALWRIFARCMLGAKQLTWSAGLKSALGLHNLSDAEIIADTEEAQLTDRRVAVLTPETWAELRVRYVDGVPGPYVVLEALTRGGPALAAEAIRTVARSTDVRTPAKRRPAEPLLAWAEECKGAGADWRPPVRQLLCFGCGSSDEETPNGDCALHELHDASDRARAKYLRLAHVIEHTCGERLCNSCGRWEGARPSRSCSSDRHWRQHDDLCRGCGRHDAVCGACLAWEEDAPRDAPKPDDVRFEKRQAIRAEAKRYARAKKVRR